MAVTRGSSCNNPDATDKDGLKVDARQIMQFGHMFMKVHNLMALNKRWIKMNMEQQLAYMKDAENDVNELRLIKVVKLFNILQPSISERMCRAGEGSRTLWSLAPRELADGVSQGRSEDMRKVRQELVTWMDWEPSFLPHNKSNRGYTHPQAGYLLSPIGLDWEDDEMRDSFLKEQTIDGLPVTEDHLPRFCYKNKQGDPVTPWIGALRGDLMIRGARAVLFSPAASQLDTPTMTAEGSRSNRRIQKRKNPAITGIAKKYEIKEITPAFLAYIAVVVRHGLTADRDYNDTNSGFNYPAFYDHVLTFLENPKYAALTNPLLKWWNKQLFGQYGVNNSSTQPTASQDGMLAMLDAALAEGGVATDPDLEGL